ncbi:MAG: hypothetical protein Q9170_008240 [Blastenia crenularia]
MDNEFDHLEHILGCEDCMIDEYVFLAGTERTAPNGKPAREDDDVLPMGWEEARAPGGRPYFLDHNTKTSTWTRPESSSCQAISLEGHESKALPSGWEKRHTRDNKVYYVDHNTRTTSWVRPDASDESTTEPLPPGWDRRRAKDGRGRLYYVNHNDKTTTWNFPKHLIEDPNEVIYLTRTYNHSHTTISSMKFFSTITAAAVLLPIALAAPAPVEFDEASFNETAPTTIPFDFNQTYIIDGNNLEKRKVFPSGLEIRTFAHPHCQAAATVHGNVGVNANYPGHFVSFSTKRQLKFGEVINFYSDEKCEHETIHTPGLFRANCYNGEARCFKLWRHQGWIY